MRKVKMLMAATGSFCALFGASGAESVKPSVSADKVLVVCYSWSGNTRFAAEEIAKAAGGRLFIIMPKSAYPRDYRACVEQARRECRDGATPELSAWPENLESYELIFVGSPNWCGTIAPPVRTFLSNPALAGKTIVPFFTHGGGGMQNCERDVRALCESSTVLAGDTFYGSTVKVTKGKFEDFVRERVNIVK